MTYITDITDENNNLQEHELEKQQLFTEKIKSSYLSNKPPVFAYIRTFGCQQNFADSEKIRGMLSEIGYSFTREPDNADLIIFNTCAVRENAEDRVFGNVGALKHLKFRKPGLIIALCGCMVQQEHIALELKEKFPFINMIFGTHVLHTLPELLYNALSDKKRQLIIPESDGYIMEGLPILRESDFKASVSIMYGCDNFCTYCIVPYVRGRERSRKASDILNEVKELVYSGCKEILLLGQNVNSYGKGTDTNFVKLLEMLNAIDGEFKIEYMTSHPKDISRELIDTISRCGKLSRHLHLPVQSGSNRILELMNRGYTRESYLEIVEYARKTIPGISITTDIIVGFPGETYEDFKQTLDLMREVQFDSAFTFIYSKRKGTKAADFQDTATDDEKGTWFRELLEIQNELGAGTYKRFIGQTVRVLCEGKGRSDEKLYTGKSDEGIIVDFDGEENMIGNFVKVKVNRSLAWALIGEAERN